MSVLRQCQGFQNEPTLKAQNCQQNFTDMYLVHGFTPLHRTGPPAGVYCPKGACWWSARQFSENSSAVPRVIPKLWRRRPSVSHNVVLVVPQHCQRCGASSPGGVTDVFPRVPSKTGESRIQGVMSRGFTTMDAWPPSHRAFTVPQEVRKVRGFQSPPAQCAINGRAMCLAHRVSEQPPVPQKEFLVNLLWAFTSTWRVNGTALILCFGARSNKCSAAVWGFWTGALQRTLVLRCREHWGLQTWRWSLNARKMAWNENISNNSTTFAPIFLCHPVTGEGKSYVVAILVYFLMRSCAVMMQFMEGHSPGLFWSLRALSQ